MEIDFAKIKKVHMIGIGGIGMSALAQLLYYEGKTVVGTNDNESPKTLDRVRELGVQIFVGTDVKNISLDTDVIVYSVAWDGMDSDFMNKVRALHIPMLTYAEMLGVVSAGKRTIAIAGTHGKTTTTAMIADVLRDGQLDPTVIVGSVLNACASNFIAGRGDLFVVEACEYKKSFLNLSPWIGVITNIDNDHLDYYGTIDGVIDAFVEFAAKIPSDGYLVCNSAGANMARVVAAAKCHVVDYSAIEPEFKLAVPGAHNVMNAQAACAVAKILEVGSSTVLGALNKFSGTWRRFEKKGTTESGALVYDDYAHHPTEVKATLRAAREFFAGKKIIAVFMPHLYSRTKLLLADLGMAFTDADEVIVSDIFAAREKLDPTITSEMLTNEIKKHGTDARYISGFDAIVEYLRANTKKDDVIFTIGAGDIYKVGDMILK